MAKQYKTVFKRTEKKYLLTSEQFQALQQILNIHMAPDAYPTSSIRSIYYDTPDFKLIRNSIEKPSYKEKLRVRSYENATDASPVFIELKKKYKHIVYKRRLTLPLCEAEAFLQTGQIPSEASQIAREIAYTLQFYGNLQPAFYIYYDRISLQDHNNKDLRITFDSNILWRTDRLDLRTQPDGVRELPTGMYVMEIKVSDSMPLWLSHTLCELQIYPTSFSKAANAYREACCGSRSSVFPPRK